MNQKIMIFFCVFTLLFLTACNQSDHESPKHRNSNPAAESQDGGEEEAKNQNTGALPDESAPKDGTQTDDMMMIRSLNITYSRSGMKMQTGKTLQP